MLNTHKSKQDKLRVLCVSIEASGDRLLALTLQALKKTFLGDIDLIGIGGQYSQAEGLVSLVDPKTLAAHGLSEALHVLPQSIKAYYKLKQAAHNVDLCLLVDSPELSMRLLTWIKMNQSEGIRQTRVFYIAPPQVWAWRSHRAKTLALADELLCLFKFEVEWFNERGIKASLIGHPLALDYRELGQGLAKTEPEIERSLLENGMVVAFFPGSRRSSVSRSFQMGLLALAKFALSVQKTIRIQIAYTPWVSQDLYSKHIKAVQKQLEAWGWQQCESNKELISVSCEHWSKQGISIQFNRVDNDHTSEVQSLAINQKHLALEHALFSLCYAGTSTLESSLAGVVPLSIAPLSRFSAFMAQRLVKVKHCALPNLCLKERAFPELHADQCNVSDILKASLLLYKDLDDYHSKVQELKHIVKPWAQHKMIEVIKSHF